MRKKHLILATVVALSASMMMQSCIGSFALFNKVKNWNDHVGDKFVNEIVFVAMWVLPVYELCFVADLFILNSIEFWSGENPALTSEVKVVDGKDAKYLVARNEGGYTITNMTTKQVTRFNFNAEDNSWSLENNGQEVKLFTFVDDTHVDVITRDGSYTRVELSQPGVLAYQELVGIGGVAFALK
ncbi:MAG: DUF3332 domain-containing protein [Muribaculaceae bacterium]|jgi:hypothetical protein|nr:DUF3332 domain-containing protein [Bacteroidales bacterium]MBQ1585535.1 DUF3332 domain-containing protein [Muribaculaceae bacterium]MBQ1745988.1 DUF3332 domain-containing protein [Muribaculaceae bacterium]MBR0494204.1 DUF3332 domain-containing protein [Muribaculaceae bacterium]MBR3728348.1 DUF3332 domain-containing protein [Muribaculaceae bacterium]